MFLSNYFRNYMFGLEYSKVDVFHGVRVDLFHFNVVA